ncbi:MAG TPA: PEP/pyruvate-binding domain-containing protein [Trebonia sp.]|nr:PEP/pyruvate-binding domain-containing protein [Trebonia sp.]
MTAAGAGALAVAFDCQAEPEYQILGGKCASLVRMTAANVPVPAGFAVTTAAFEQATRPAGLTERIRGMLVGLDAADTAAVTMVAELIRELILAQPIPGAVRAAFDAAYEDLTRKCGGEVPVAVRSSATAEDMPDASFAGQQDTHLWVRGRDDVLLKIRECWASLYTSRAITYRLANDVPDEGLSMAVGVQKMVNARSAGVAMTLNPSNGDRSKIVIDSSWGIGELVVAGEITPDNFVVDKVMLAVVRRTIADKPRQLVADAQQSRLVLTDVDADKRQAPSLSDEELLAVAKLAKTAERYYRGPQDVEWAIDRDLPAPHNVLLLQSRPETVWSRRPTTVQVSSAGAGISSITRTLLGQVGER